MTQRPPREWAMPGAPANGPLIEASPVAAGTPGALSLDEARQRRVRARASRMPVRLRPLRLVDVFDNAFAIIKAQPRVVALLVVPLVLPISLVQAYAGRSSSRAAIVDFFGSPGRFGRAVGGDAALFVLYTVDLLVIAVVGVVLATLLEQWFGGDVPDAWVTWRRAARLVPTAAAAFVLVHIIEAIAVLGLVVGLYFVMPLLVVVSPAIAFERIGPWSAVRRSWTLGRRHYSQALGFVTFSALIVFLLGVLFGWLPSVIAGSLGDRWYGWVVVGVTGVILTSITTAFIGLSAALLYLNLRVRSEGLDIELQVGELLPDA